MDFVTRVRSDLFFGTLIDRFLTEVEALWRSAYEGENRTSSSSSAAEYVRTLLTTFDELQDGRTDGLYNDEELAALFIGYKEALAGLVPQAVLPTQLETWMLPDIVRMVRRDVYRLVELSDPMPESLSDNVAVRKLLLRDSLVRSVELSCVAPFASVPLSAYQPLPKSRGPAKTAIERRQPSTIKPPTQASKQLDDAAFAAELPTQKELENYGLTFAEPEN